MMMTLKLGYREFVRNLWFNLLVLAQLTTAFFLTTALASSVESRFQFYTPFEEEFDSQGMMLKLINPLTYGAEHRKYLTKEELMAGNPWIQNVIGVSVVFNALDYEQPLLQSCAYSPEIYRRFRPTLSGGVWLGEAKAEAGYINVVVTESAYAYKIGDVVNAGFRGVDESQIPVKMKVVGVVAEGSWLKLFNDYTYKPDASSWDYRDFYTVYSYAQTETPYVLMAIEDVEAYGIAHVLMEKTLVTYRDGISEQERKQADAYLQSGLGYGVAFGATLEEVNANSLDYIWRQMFFLLPIIIAVLMLLLVGSFSVNTIHAKRQLRNYGVYYMHGSRWIQCGLIHVVSALIVTVLAAILCWIFIALGVGSGLLKDTAIKLGVPQTLACVIVALLNLLFSCVAPFMLLGRWSPRQVIGASE